MSGSADVVVLLRALTGFADLEESHCHGIHDEALREWSVSQVRSDGGDCVGDVVQEVGL